MFVTIAFIAHAASLVVDGVGEVSMEDAEQTCLTGVAQGSVRKALQGTEPGQMAFVGTVQLLAAAPALQESWATSPWPDPDPTLIPDVSRSPDAVAASCLAVGQARLAVTEAIAKGCRYSLESCRNTVTRASSKELRAALKSAERLEERSGARQPRSDGLLDAIYALDIPGAQSPWPMLERACTWPERTAATGTFLTTEELSAARLACLQLRFVLGRPSGQPPCVADWNKLSDYDTSRLVSLSETDGGLGYYLSRTASRSVSSTEPWTPDVAIRALDERLVAMDPSPRACADAGVLYRGTLTHQWRAGQAVRACASTALPLSVRARHCTSLPTDLHSACEQGDARSCMGAGRIHQHALGVSEDRVAAVFYFQYACDLGMRRGCHERYVLTAGLQQDYEHVMREGRLDVALSLLGAYAEALGSRWQAAEVAVLFAALVEAERRDLAQTLLDRHGLLTTEEWRVRAQKQLR